MEDLLAPELLGEHCKLFSKVCLKPGCEIGYHEHHGETEAYYVLSGTAIYEDNKKMILVEAGDITYCEEGAGHSIRNMGVNDLVFIALILNRQTPETLIKN